MRFEFEITAADSGRRLDRYLQRALRSVPFPQLRRLLRQRKVRVNGKRARADRILVTGDQVVVHHRRDEIGESSSPVSPAPGVTPAHHAASARSAPPASSGEYRGPPIPVLDEREGFLLIDKPAGVSCSDDGTDPTCLARWLAGRFADQIARQEMRPEPCHRLDRDTTGVVAVALDAASFERFRRALLEQRVHKRYEVAVWGAPATGAFLCELPLIRRAHGRRDEPKVIAIEKPERSGAPAISGGLEPTTTARTRFTLLGSSGEASLLEAEPLTGRTHQIRAHCLALQLPVIGDRRYGDPARDRQGGIDRIVDHQLLHARHLNLDDPIVSWAVEAPWPTEGRQALERLGLLAG